jgi:chemotaxis regulatin CheY-phosphate phosphatase CheZ
MSNVSQQFTLLAKQLVDLTKNDSIANHFQESPERIAKYWQEIMQFAIHRKRFKNDIETITNLLNIKTFEDRCEDCYEEDNYLLLISKIYFL